MADMRDVVDRALRQAFRAGWWRRAQAPALGATVEDRNRTEDADVPAMVERALAAMTAIESPVMPVQGGKEE